MSFVTLVGAPFAKEGMEFIFFGGTRKCEECRLKDTCLNLEPGRKYRVLHVREGFKHECALHDGGVCVVEVEEAEIEAALEARKALEGSKIRFELPKCEEYDCNLRDLCFPAGLNDGEKCTVLKVIDETETCPKKGVFMKKVLLRRDR
ncbi:MAG: UPF0179 family protein [Canidatus Methanoxibalbensis ujae]|nr:UPF0179 family protein [Candidatus Methanoxibalbensis ujae]MCW7078297.1 UPF0179 family protein [Candidatus Methanoxibalbensis ujae]